METGKHGYEEGQKKQGCVGETKSVPPAYAATMQRITQTPLTKCSLTHLRGPLAFDLKPYSSWGALPNA